MDFPASNHRILNCHDPEAAQPDLEGELELGEL